MKVLLILPAAEKGFNDSRGYLRRIRAIRRAGWREGIVGFDPAVRPSPKRGIGDRLLDGLWRIACLWRRLRAG